MICIQFTKNRHIICFLFASRRHKSFEKNDQSFGKWICNIINYPLTFSCSGCTFLSKQRSILIYVCHLLKPIYWALTLWPFFLTVVFVQFMIKYKVARQWNHSGLADAIERLVAPSSVIYHICHHILPSWTAIIHCYHEFPSYIAILYSHHI